MLIHSELYLFLCGIVCMLAVLVSAASSGQSTLSNDDQTVISVLSGSDRKSSSYWPGTDDDTISNRQSYRFGTEDDGNLCSKCSSSEDCPPWFYCNQTSHHCLCGDTHHDMIQCSSTLCTLAVRNSYCVTYNTTTNTTMAGSCLYNSFSVDPENKDAVYVYSPLLLEKGGFSNQLCKYFNRKGRFCGQCEDNFTSVVYSYDLRCVNCSNGHINWWKFVLVAFLPLTFFYLFILFFKVNLTTSHLRTFVLFSQCALHPTFARFFYLTVAVLPVQKIMFKIFMTVYGIWNLDFFRALWPDICLNISPLAALALDYAVAVYPLFLIIITYFMVELHDRNFKPIVLLWKPFRYVFTFFRRNWNIRTSIIDAYASFLLLAFMKILSVSSDILSPVYVYEFHANNKTIDSFVAVFYDASIAYFSKEHLKYAIPAILIVFVFIFLPILILLLYPFTFFQKFLNCFPIKWHILHTFVDSFQGCYKNGTEPGERDCRWFAALFLLLRVALYIIYCLTLSSAYFPSGAIFLTFFVMLLVSVQPYKERVAYYSKINVVFLLLLIALHLTFAGLLLAAFVRHESTHAYVILTDIILLIPFPYMICSIIYWLHSQKNWGKDIVQRIRASQKGYVMVDDFYPDRMENPNHYCTY